MLSSVEPQQEQPSASIPQGGFMEGQSNASFHLSSFLEYLFSKTLNYMFQKLMDFYRSLKLSKITINWIL